MLCIFLVLDFAWRYHSERAKNHPVLAVYYAHFFGKQEYSMPFLVDLIVLILCLKTAIIFKFPATFQYLYRPKMVFGIIAVLFPLSIVAFVPAAIDLYFFHNTTLSRYEFGQAQFLSEDAIVKYFDVLGHAGLFKAAIAIWFHRDHHRHYSISE